jgi:hypothetical protein
MQCISRRACADRDTIRLLDKQGNPGRHVWVEYRCPSIVPGGMEVCHDCSYKLPKYKYQANQKCDHGHIGGPYPADSKLYGSAFYLKLLKEGWRISEADEIRAKAAVDKATMGRKKVIAEPVAVPVTVTEPVAALVAAPVVETVAAPVAEPVAEPVVTKAKRTYKKKTPEEKAAVAAKAIKSGKPVKIDVLLPTPPPVTEIPCDPKFIESIAPPIVIEEFVTVKVKKMTIQGKQYYYHANSGKLYGISVNGVGGYKGRYNAEEDAVDTTFPDSDLED